MLKSRELLEYQLCLKCDVSNSGTEIFFTIGKFEGQTLAYVEDVTAIDLDSRSLFKPGSSDSALPEPIA